MRLPGPFFAALPLMLLAACSTQPPPRPTPPTIRASQRPAVLARLGDDMRGNGDPAGALALYRAAAQAQPRNPVPLLRMGDALTDMNDPQRAEQAYRGALTLAPDNTDAKRGLAVTLLAQNRPAEALPLLQSLDNGTTDLRVLRAEGTALELMGQDAAAQAVYRRGLQQAPIDAGLHGNLALSLALSGDTAGAMAEMRAAVGSPTPDPREEANAVLVLALIGSTDEARSRGEQTIGAAATQALLDRAAQARDAAGGGRHAAALGVLTSSSPSAPPAPQTSLPPPAQTAPVPVSAPASVPPAIPLAAGSPPMPALPTTVVPDQQSPGPQSPSPLTRSPAPPL